MRDKAKEQPLIWIIRINLVLTVCVIVLGAYTRLSDAGLGCPDWPGCYGQWNVPGTATEVAQANQLYPERPLETDKAWAEMIHRYFAGVLGLMIFTISALSLRHREAGRVLPVSLSVLVIAQALLGMWTVTLKLMPVIVLAHLFGGFTLFCLLVLLYTKLHPAPIRSVPLTSAPSSSVRMIGIFSLLAIIGQIFLGGWTSANYAALMCTDLPVCQGNWSEQLDFKTAFTLIQAGHDNYEFGVLDYSGRMTIHVAHRFGAIVATILISILCWLLFSQSDLFLRRQAQWLFIMLTLQLSLGVSNVVFHLPLSIAVLHNLGGALLLVTLVRLNYLLLQHDKEQKQINESSFRGSYE